MNPDYFSDLNTKILARVVLQETKIASFDFLVPILKSRGLDYMPIQNECEKIHTKIDALREILEAELP